MDLMPNSKPVHVSFMIIFLIPPRPLALASHDVGVNGAEFLHFFFRKLAFNSSGNFSVFGCRL